MKYGKFRNLREFLSKGWVLIWVGGVAQWLGRRSLAGGLFLIYA